MIQTIQMLAGPDNIDQTLKKHDLDLIIGPSDSHLASVADLAGITNNDLQTYAIS